MQRESKTDTQILKKLLVNVTGEVQAKHYEQKLSQHEYP